MENTTFTWNHSHILDLIRCDFNAITEYMIRDRDSKTAAVVDWDLDDDEEAELISAFKAGEDACCDIRPVPYDYNETANGFEILA